MPLKSPKTAPLDIETSLWQNGCLRVFGLDEAGRGAWAGPVVAAAVCIPHDHIQISDILRGVNDSKQLTAQQREVLAQQIRENVPYWAVGEASSEEIDKMGIVPATKTAMRHAMDAICAVDNCIPDHLLLDALRWDYQNTPYTPLIKGDSRSLSIAAASILAKVHRDHLMIALDAQYPDYGFAGHKGYGTVRHQQALNQLGASPAHRRSFAPIRARLF